MGNETTDEEIQLFVTSDGTEKQKRLKKKKRNEIDWKEASCWFF
jgi:hypothetical protein